MDPVVAEFVERVRRRLGDRLLRVSLFGSRGRGTHQPYSDYDLLVVVRGDRSSAKDQVHWVDTELLLERAVDVSPKVVTEQDFERLYSSPFAFWRRFRRDEVVAWTAEHLPPR